MSARSITTLLLPNQGHPYGNALQQSLQKAGVMCLKCDAGWGFDLAGNIQIIAALKPDILHLQWPESLCTTRRDDDLKQALQNLDQAFSEIRQNGVRIVWTVHNLRPHIIFDIDFQSRIYQIFAKHAEGVIHHSHCGKLKVTQAYSFPHAKKHATLRHGYFTQGLNCQLSQGHARLQLGLPQGRRIFLFCGAFRRDKNIDVLVRALGDSRPDAGDCLIMAGQEKEVAAALYPELDFEYPNIIWPGHLSFADLAVYAKAADAFVFAHGDKHLTSGGPHLSQSHLKTQICPYSDYTQEVLGESAFYYDKGDNFRASLRHRLDEVTPVMLHKASERLQEQRSEYHWDVIGRKTKAFYQELLNVR